MKLHFLSAPPPEWLGLALEEFEAQFRYPLGQDASFSISHGRDYITFFNAIGDATVLVAEREGRVMATLAAVLRPLRFPNGGIRNVAYLGDLKLAPSARGGMVLGRIFSVMRERLAGPSSGFGYGIVMGGTGRIPSNYTGRLQVPAFEPVAQLSILCISTTAARFVEPVQEITSSELEPLYAKLAPQGFIPLGGKPELRSQQTPIALASGKALACGLLEDTRRGKRLVLGPGKELVSAHLSRFAFASAQEGVSLIRHAASRCSHADIPNLFVSIPSSVSPALRPMLADLEVKEAPATVYGCGFGTVPADWWVDTAEI